MACVGTYSPDAVDVIISNDEMNHIVTGFAEGTFISIEPHADRFTSYYGAKGDPSRVHDPVYAFNIALTLAQTSHSNDVFTHLLRRDRQTLRGTFNLTLKDSSGTTLYNERCAYIGVEPTQSFSGGGTMESREWTIHLPNPDYVIGGNDVFSPEVQESVESLGAQVDPQWQS